LLAVATIVDFSNGLDVYEIFVFWVTKESDSCHHLAYVTMLQADST
jgi:hypothetical protein